MATACPNKNSREWKYLTQELGEVNAYKVFLHNKESVPNMANAVKYVEAYKQKLNPSIYSNPQTSYQYFMDRLMQYGYNPNTGYTNIDYSHFDGKEHVLDFFRKFGFTPVRGANNKLGIKRGDKMFTANNKNPKTSWINYFDPSSPMFSLMEGTPRLSTKQAAELKRLLETFMDANGIRRESLPEALAILKKQGRISTDTAGIGGVADALRRVVAVAEGNAEVETLTEEVGHIAIALLGPEHELIAPILQQIEGYSKFNQLYSTYFNAYKETLGMSDKEADKHTRMEIAGHALMDHLMDTVSANDRQDNPSLWRNLRRVWRRIVEWFSGARATSLERNLSNNLGQLASKILSGETIEEVTPQDTQSIFYSLNKERLTGVSKQVLSELRYRKKTLQEKVALYREDDQKNYDKLSRLRQRIESLEDAINNNEMAIGVWNHLKMLDEDLAALRAKQLALPDSVLRNDPDLLEEMMQFLESNKGIVNEIRINLRDILNEEPESLPEVTQDELEQVVSNAIQSLETTRVSIKRLQEEYLDNKLVELNPDQYRRGDVFRTFDKDLGIGGLILQFAGSLKNATNVYLQRAFRVMSDVHNEVTHHALEVKNELVTLLQEAEKEGFRPEEMLETKDGKITGRIINKWDRAAIDKAYDSAKQEIIAAYKKLYDNVETMEDVAIRRSALRERDYKDLTKEEKHVLNSDRAIWRKTHNLVYNTSVFPDISPTDVEDTILEESFIGYEFSTTMHQVLLDGSPLELAEGNIVSIRDKDGNPTRTFAKVTSIDETNNKARLVIVDSTDLGISGRFATDKGKLGRFVNLEDPENPKTAIQKFYKRYTEILQEEKKKLPIKYQIGKNKWMAPQILATQEELVKTGRFSQIKGRFKESYVRNAQDDELYGGRQEAIGGKIHRYLPVYFTAPIERPELMSYDLVGSLTKFAGMSENYKQLNQKKSELLALQRVLGESKFQTKGILGGKEVLGTSTQSYKMLDGFLRTHLWGEKQTAKTLKVGDGKKEIQVDKVLDSFYNWIQDTNLALSIPVAVSGAVKASIDQSIERILGEVISKESSVYSSKEAVKILSDVIADAGARKKTHKLSALLEYTGLAFEDSMKNLNLSSRASRMLGKDLLYSPYFLTEINRKSRLLISIMDNLRYIDGVLYTKAQYLKVNKSDNAQKIWEDNRSNSLWNKAEMQNGNLSGLSKEDLFKIKDFAMDLGPRLEGRVSSLERGAAYRDPYARFLFMHRSWLISGFEHRFKGQITNQLTGVKEEGTYVTAYRAFRYLKKNALSPDLMKAYWKELPDWQKRNLIRVGADFAWMTAIHIMAAAINALAADSDDDDWFLQYSAYQASRILLEQQAFWNPTEVFSILKSPAAGVNHFEDLLALPGEMFFDWDPLESGPYEGKTKFERFLWKRLYFKNLYELQHPKSKNQWIRSQVLKTGLNSLFYEPLEDALRD